jgi:hypothetical protein
MMKLRVWGVLSVFAIALAAIVACSGTNSKGPSGTGTSFQALCVSSCPKGCGGDSDCSGQGAERSPHPSRQLRVATRCGDVS